MVLSGPRPHCSRQTSSRRTWLKLSLAAGCGLAGGAVAESVAIAPQLLTTTRLSLGSPGPTGQPARRPLRVVQLSDLHIRRIGRLETNLLSAVTAAAPDMILLTGDALDQAVGSGPLHAFLDQLPAAPHRLAIMGNWEYNAGLTPASFQRLLDRHGFRLLTNETVLIEHDGQPLLISGLDDLLGGQPAVPTGSVARDPQLDHLLLAHCPASRDQLPAIPGPAATLMLSGHTHGGQIAPAGFCLVTPPGSGSYVAGWYCDNGPPLYVSRGIGTSMVPLRMGSLPELVTLDWWLGCQHPDRPA
jgi:predicted MPP superfamily phosphohydrolase